MTSLIDTAAVVSQKVELLRYFIYYVANFETSIIRSNRLINMASFCCVLNLDFRRLGQIFATIVLVASSIFGHAEEDSKKHERKALEELNAETFLEIQRSGEARMRALRDAHQRAATENIPISNRPYPVFDRPIAIGDFIPFKFKPLQTVPKMLLSHANLESRGVDERRSPLWFMEKFNIQVLVEDEDIEFPNSVTMTFSLSKPDISVDRSISMLLNEEESAYYFEDPFELMQSMGSAVEEVQLADPRNRNRPTLEIHHLVGFEDAHAYAEENYFPTGVPVVYSLRIGDLRLDTNHSWIGRAVEFTNLTNELLWLK